MCHARRRSGELPAPLADPPIAPQPTHTRLRRALLRQLVRHDRNIKRGLTSLTQPNEDVGALRTTKVAVSRIGYGPASDHVLAGALFRSIVEVRFHPVMENTKHAEILCAFNRKLNDIMRDMEAVTIQDDGTIDLLAWIMHEEPILGETQEPPCGTNVVPTTF